MIDIEKFTVKNVFSFIKPVNVLYVRILIEKRIHLQLKAKQIFYLTLQVSWYRA